MKATTRILLTLAAAGALALAASLLVPGTSRGANPVLNGTVGGGGDGNAFIITLTDANGQRITHLDTGTYDVNVDDMATIHNFHLSGPGVDQKTDVDTTGKVTWTVTFTDGTYTYVCDAHPSLQGSFTVGTPPPPPPPPPVLKGSVGPGHTISLKKSGAAVKSLKAGKYTVKVRDRSAKLNFHLKGPGVNKKTGVPFKGRKTWKVKLRAGKYVYKSDAGKHLKKHFTVH
jgi:plastocyanin